MAQKVLVLRLLVQTVVEVATVCFILLLRMAAAAVHLLLQV